MNNTTTTTNEDKYFKIQQWLRKRYTKNGLLTIEVGGKPTKYKRLEKLAWFKYMLNGYRWMEMTDGSWELCSVSRSGLTTPCNF
jgi:hypothetical protein